VVQSAPREPQLLADGFGTHASGMLLDEPCNQVRVTLEEPRASALYLCRQRSDVDLAGSSRPKAAGKGPANLDGQGGTSSAPYALR
jgi:hypothetical protein